MKKYRLEIFLFLSVWLAYGLTINSRNLEAFNLQQMGVEAIVERGHFYLEGSPSAQLQPRGDVFTYEGHKYAAKQPGQFMAGALVYLFLHAFGLSYAKNYLMTSALVTFLTASLVTAVATTALSSIARAILKDGAGRFRPLAVALAYAMGTTVYAYSGIAHHDAIASGLVLIAFYFAFRTARDSSKGGWLVLFALAAGLFLGLTVTTSMPAFWPAIAIGLYFLSLTRWHLLPYFILGGVAGLLPLLFYDAINFGNPFLLPNVAGNYSDTFFHLDFNNFKDKLGFYLKWTTLYAPVFWLGLACLTQLPRAFRREKLAAAGAIILLCAYIFNIDSVGTCAYGPRYLLPAMAFGCLGLVGISYLESKGARAAWGVMLLLAGLVSFAVNAVGAIQGAMYCDLARHAFWPYISSIRRGETGSFPLFSWLFIPTLLSIYRLASLCIKREAEPKEQSAIAP